jgi:hypothetical protein
VAASNEEKHTLFNNITKQALLLVFISTTAMAMETSYFAAPSLIGFNKTSEENADGDGDGIKETHVIHYVNEAGDRLFSMTTQGTLWAWSHQSQASTEALENYVIRDSNCDGVFDERYTLDEEFHVPDCLKNTPKQKPADHP